MKRVLLVIAFMLSHSVSAQTRMIEVEVNRGLHQVVSSWLVDGEFADQGVDESAHVLTVQLWQDQTLVQTYFRKNPLVVHAPLSENGDASEHHTEQLSTSLYHLRVPEHLGVNRVTVSAPTDTDQVHSRSLHKNTESPLIDFHF